MSTAEIAGAAWLASQNARNDSIKGSFIDNGLGVRRPSGENTQPNNFPIYYSFWLFQLFLIFSKSFYHELSGYVSNISIVCHTLLQEVQEHSPFCSFSWKFRFLLLAQVRKQVQNFTGGPMGIQIQLFLHKIGSTNMLIINFQKKLGAIKV